VESPGGWTPDEPTGYERFTAQLAAFAPLQLTRSLDPTFDGPLPHLNAPSPLRDAHRDPQSPPRPSFGASPAKRARLDVAPAKRRCIQLPAPTVDGPVARPSGSITASTPFLAPGACFSGRQVFEPLLRRRLGDEADRGPVEKSWAVDLTITRVDLERGVLDGVMRAIDVPIGPCEPSEGARRAREPTVRAGPFADDGGTARSRQPSNAAPPSNITTYFRGEIVDGVNFGLHGEHGEFGTTPATDLEYYRRLPAFSGVSAVDLRAGLAQDGYVLLRLKETEFINVERDQSQLSIDVRLHSPSTR